MLSVLTPAPTAFGAPILFWPDEEVRFVNLVNDYRAQGGNGSATRSKCLTEAARDWSARMAASDTLVHSHSNWRERYCGDFSSSGLGGGGEVIAKIPWWYFAEGALETFQGSPPHNSIIQFNVEWGGAGFAYEEGGTYAYITYIVAGCSSGCSSAVTDAPDDGAVAAVCSSVNAPSTVRSYDSFSGSTYFKNTGQSNWPGDTFTSFSKSPDYNTLWGQSTIELGVGTAEYIVRPGFSGWTSDTFKAPRAPGTYLFRWQMQDESNTAFGDYCSKTIRVTRNTKYKMDANPALAIDGSDKLFAAHTRQIACAEVWDKSTVASEFTKTDDIGSSCFWSTGGTLDIEAIPATSDEALIVAAKTVNDCAELYTFDMSGGTVSNGHKRGSFCDWSYNHSPSLAIDSSNNQYLAGVKENGNLYIFRKANGGLWTVDEHITDIRRVPLGSSPKLAVEGDGTIWLAYVDANNTLVVFKRKPSGQWERTRGVFGTFSTEAAPGIVVDDDGDVTYAAVTTNGYVKSFRICNSCAFPHDIGKVSTSGNWTKSGTINLTVDSNDIVWAAMVRDVPGDFGKLWVIKMVPDQVTNYLGNWGGARSLGITNDWSEHSAPDIVVGSDDSLYVFATKSNERSYVFKRDPSGVWTNYGKVDGSGWAGAFN